MAKAYFNRQVPMYVLSADELGDNEGFDAYPVEIDGLEVEKIQALRELLLLMEAQFMNSPAPEEAAQMEADLFVAGLKEIFNG
jgi:hypothetical protein